MFSEKKLMCTACIGEIKYPLSYVFLQRYTDKDIFLFLALRHFFSICSAECFFIMKKTLIILFTLFISAAAVFSVFASESLNEGENSSVSTAEAITEEESTKDIIDAAAKSEPTQSLIAETETAQPESPSESSFAGSISSDAEKAKKSAALYAAADYENVRFFRCKYDIEDMMKV